MKHDRSSWTRSPDGSLAGLVRWLNQRKGDRGYSHHEDRDRAKVREIISLLQQLYSLEPQWKERSPVPLPPGTKPSEVRYIQTRLNQLLAKHRGIRLIVDLGQDEIISRWMPIRPRNFSSFLYINVAMDLADNKLLSRIRLCGCGKYFVARSSLTRFCSAACRVGFWENSEERKEQKRKNARDYYMLHKAGIVKSRGKAEGSK